MLIRLRQKRIAVCHIIQFILFSIICISAQSASADVKKRFKDQRLSDSGSWLATSSDTKTYIENNHFATCTPPVTWDHTSTTSGTETYDQWWEYRFSVKCSNFYSPKDVWITQKKCINGTYWDNTTHSCVQGIDPDPQQCSLTSSDDGNGQCAYPVVTTEESFGGCCSKSPITTPNKPSKQIKRPIVRSDPINIGTGNVFKAETDYRSSTLHGLKYTRYYNSLSRGFITLLGWGWTADYWQTIVDVDADTVHVYRPDGKIYTFNLVDGAWTSTPDVLYSLVELKDAQGNRTGWKLTLPNDSVEQYNYDGQTRGWLSSITYRDGLVTQVQYDLSTAEGGDGDYRTLDRVIDPFGREMTFTSNGLNLQSMTDPSGKTYTYGRDSNNNLISVTYPDDTPGDPNDNPQRIYHYDNAFVPNAMTGITDENGNQVATWDYDDQGRAIMSEHAGGTEHTELVYNNDGTTTVTDGLGHVSTNTLGVSQNDLKITAIDAPCTECGNYQSISYDTNGFLSSRTDFDGNITNYVYNTRGLEISRTEAVGTSHERTITTTWDTNYRLPTDITEPGKETTFTYDNKGRLLTKTETDTTTQSSRTTTYTYYGSGESSPEGLLKSGDGPRTDVNDVTTYDYDSQGNLIHITDALGHETDITSYDANGRPLSITDPNGTVTTLTYDARGRLLTRTVDGQTTSFDYDAVGNIIKTTLPNGAYLTNEYDAAERLTAVEDNLGNRIEYTLDGEGNRTQENIKDPQGTLTRTLSRTYNDLNRLTQTMGGAGQTTTYAYDDNGNRTGITVDPSGLNQQTTQAFDALNRLITTTDADNGVTTYTYDDRDNLTSVTDPKGLTTNYTYDGLDNLVEQDSPDTGTTTYTYDAAGNRLSQTDARSITSTYTYDALNRLTSITYPDTNQDVTYSYDTCTNGIGKLCEMVDESGTTDYTYDARGNLVSETTTRDSFVESVGYTYNGANQLTQITYPSGRTVDYQRDALGQVETVTTTKDGTTQTLADNLTYDPFGPLTALDYGNGLTESRSYDQAYRLTSLTSGGVEDRTYTLDPADNITVITDNLDNSRNQSFSYDALNRLTDAAGIYGDINYTYDADGNRLSKTVGTQTDTYTYDTSSNHLLQRDDGSTISYSYDANGNTLSNTAYDFVFGDNNRLSEAQVSGASVADYVYNGKGERVKQTSSGTTLYYFDQSGQLLAELDGNGNTLKEYVYLNGRPLALIESGSIYSIHTDHLGAPQVITDSSQQVVWKADYQPFGQVDISTEAITNNLRFPGQYFDEVAGLYYNYFRDYDPDIGRYIESDSIGLYGGINTYMYVLSNPLKYTDSSGDLPNIGAGIKKLFAAIAIAINLAGTPTQNSSDNLNTKNAPAGEQIQRVIERERNTQRRPDKSRPDNSPGSAAAGKPKSFVPGPGNIYLAPVIWEIIQEMCREGLYSGFGCLVKSGSTCPES